MKLNKEQKEIIIRSIKNEFLKYQIITNDFIMELMNVIEQQENEFKQIQINKDIYNNPNDIIILSMNIKMIIYNYLCKMSEEDVDTYIELTNYIEKIITMYETKRKITLDSKIKNTDNIINNYKGDISFNRYIVKYIQALKNGTTYYQLLESKPIVILEDEVTLTKKEKKKLKKAEKLKRKQQRIQEQREEDKVSDIEQQEKNTQQKLEEQKTKTVLQPGTAVQTKMTKIFRMIDIEFDTEDEKFKNFIMLRYGYLNDSYYTLEEIEKILNISSDKVKEYELKTVLFIKDNVNKVVNNYKLKLKQGQ